MGSEMCIRDRFMDVGNDNGWNFDKVVTKKEMLDEITSSFDIEPVDALSLIHI